MVLHSAKQVQSICNALMICALHLALEASHILKVINHLVSFVTNVVYYLAGPVPFLGSGNYQNIDDKKVANYTVENQNKLARLSF